MREGTGMGTTTNHQALEKEIKTPKDRESHTKTSRLDGTLKTITCVITLSSSVDKARPHLGVLI